MPDGDEGRQLEAELREKKIATMLTDYDLEGDLFQELCESVYGNFWFIVPYCTLLYCVLYTRGVDMKLPLTHRLF